MDGPSRNRHSENKYAEKTYYCETCSLSIMGREEYMDHQASVMHRMSLDRSRGRRNIDDEYRHSTPPKASWEVDIGKDGADLHMVDPFLRDTTRDEEDILDGPDNYPPTRRGYYDTIPGISDSLGDRQYDRSHRSDSRDRLRRHDLDRDLRDTGGSGSREHFRQAGHDLDRDRRDHRDLGRSDSHDSPRSLASNFDRDLRDQTSRERMRSAIPSYDQDDWEPQGPSSRERVRHAGHDLDRDLRDSGGSRQVIPGLERDSVGSNFRDLSRQLSHDLDRDLRDTSSGPRERLGMSDLDRDLRNSMGARSQERLRKPTDLDRDRRDPIGSESLEQSHQGGEDLDRDLRDQSDSYSYDRNRPATYESSSRKSNNEVESRESRLAALGKLDLDFRHAAQRAPSPTKSDVSDHSSRSRDFDHQNDRFGTYARQPLGKSDPPSKSSPQVGDSDNYEPVSMEEAYLQDISRPEVNAPEPKKGSLGRPPVNSHFDSKQDGARPGMPMPVPPPPIPKPVPPPNVSYATATYSNTPYRDRQADRDIPGQYSGFAAAGSFRDDRQSSRSPTHQSSRSPTRHSSRSPTHHSNRSPTRHHQDSPLGVPPGDRSPPARSSPSLGVPPSLSAMSRVIDMVQTKDSPLANLGKKDPALTAIELLMKAGITDDSAISSTAATIINQVLDGNFSLLPFAQSSKSASPPPPLKEPRVSFENEVHIKEIPASSKTMTSTGFNDDAPSPEAFFPETPKVTFEDSPDDVASPASFYPKTPKPTFDDTSSSDDGERNFPSIGPPPTKVSSESVQWTSQQQAPSQPTPAISQQPPGSSQQSRVTLQETEATLKQTQASIEHLKARLQQSQATSQESQLQQHMTISQQQDAGSQHPKALTQQPIINIPHKEQTGSQPSQVSPPPPPPPPAPQVLKQQTQAELQQKMPPPKQPPPKQQSQEQAAFVKQTISEPNQAPNLVPLGRPPPVEAMENQHQALFSSTQAQAPKQDDTKGDAKEQPANKPTEKSADESKNKNTEETATEVPPEGWEDWGSWAWGPWGPPPPGWGPPGWVDRGRGGGRGRHPWARGGRGGDRGRGGWGEMGRGGWGGWGSSDWAGPNSEWGGSGWGGSGWGDMGRGGWGDRGRGRGDRGRGRGAGWGDTLKGDQKPVGDRAEWAKSGGRGEKPNENLNDKPKFGRDDRGRDSRDGRPFGRDNRDDRGGDSRSYGRDNRDDRGRSDRDQRGRDSRDDRDRDGRDSRERDGRVRTSRWDSNRDDRGRDTRDQRGTSRSRDDRPSQSIPGARSKQSSESMEKENLMRLVNAPRSHKERLQIARILHMHQQKTKRRLNVGGSKNKVRNPLEVFVAGGELNLDDLPDDVQKEIATLLAKEAENEGKRSKDGTPEPRSSQETKPTPDSAESQAEVKPQQFKSGVELGNCRENQIMSDALKEGKRRPDAADPALTATASGNLAPPTMRAIGVDVKKEGGVLDLDTPSNIPVKMDLSGASDNKINISFNEKGEPGEDSKAGVKRPIKPDEDASSADGKRRRVGEGDGKVGKDEKVVVIVSDPVALLEKDPTCPVAQTVMMLSLHEEEVKRHLRLANMAIVRLEALARRTAEQITERLRTRKRLMREEGRLRMRRLRLIKERVDPNIDITDTSSVDQATPELDSSSKVADPQGSRADSMGETIRRQAQDAGVNVKYMGSLKVGSVNPGLLKELTSKIDNSATDKENPKTPESDTGPAKESWLNQYISSKDKKKHEDKYKKKSQLDREREREKERDRERDRERERKREKEKHREREKDRDKERERERIFAERERERERGEEKKSELPPPKTPVVLKSKSSHPSESPGEKRKRGRPKVSASKEKAQDSPSSSSKKESAKIKSQAIIDSSSDEENQKPPKKKPVIDSGSGSDGERQEHSHKKQKLKKKRRIVTNSSGSDSDTPSKITPTKPKASRQRKFSHGASKKPDPRMAVLLKKYLHASARSAKDVHKAKTRPIFDITKLRMRPVVVLKRINVKAEKKKLKKSSTARLKSSSLKKLGLGTSMTVNKLFKMPEKPLFSDSDSDAEEGLKIDLGVLDPVPKKKPAVRLPSKDIGQCAQDDESKKSEASTLEEKDTFTVEAPLPVISDVRSVNEFETQEKNEEEKRDGQIPMEVDSVSSVPIASPVDTTSEQPAPETTQDKPESTSDEPSSGTSTPKDTSTGESEKTNSVPWKSETQENITGKTDTTETTVQHSDKADESAVIQNVSGVEKTRPEKNSRSGGPVRTSTKSESHSDTEADNADNKSEEATTEKKSAPESEKPEAETAAAHSEKEDGSAEEESTAETSTSVKPKPTNTSADTETGAEDATANHSEDGDGFANEECLAEAPASEKLQCGGPEKIMTNSDTAETASDDVDRPGSTSSKADTALDEPPADAGADKPDDTSPKPDGGDDKPETNSDEEEDTASTECVQPIQFKGHTEAVHDMCVWGDFLFTASEDMTACKFDIKSGTCLAIYEGHKKGIQCIRVCGGDGFAPILFTGSFDNSIRGYNIDTADREARHKFAHRVYCFHVVGGMLYIGLGNGNVACLDVELDKVVETFRCADSPIKSLGSGREGMRKLLVVAANDTTVSVRDMNSGLLIRHIEGHSHAPMDMKVANDLVYSAALDKTMQVHDLHTGDLKATLSHKAIVTSVVVQNSTVFTSGYEGLIRCYKAKTYDLEKLYYGAGNTMVTSMVVNGNKVITGNKDGIIEACTMDSAQNWACQFGLCPFMFGLRVHLEHHVLTDHLLPGQESVRCLWTDCSAFVSTKEDALAHFTSHMDQLSK